MSEPTSASDLADKLGILAGTNHRHLEPVSRLEPVQEGSNILSAEASRPSGELVWERVAMRAQVSLAGEEWEQKYRESRAESEQLKADVKRLSKECDDRTEQARAKIDQIEGLLQ